MTTAEENCLQIHSLGNRNSEFILLSVFFVCTCMFRCCTPPTLKGGFATPPCCRHADNGRSWERVSQLLARHSCDCHRGKCFRKCSGSVADIMKFLNIFWAMEKPAQDAYVLDLAANKIISMRDDSQLTKVSFECLIK